MATIKGTSGNDTLSGNQNDDTLFGFAGDDLLLGRRGNDVLYGGRGKDTLRGGNGDDTLYGGLDDDILYGGNGNNILYGGLGDDVLYGVDGNDTLYGGAGNDTLSGGYGQKVLYGGDGDDTYIIDGYSTSQIIEAANSGIDTVILDYYNSATVRYELSANLENLTITDRVFPFIGIGTGTGNNLNNTITGNSSDNGLYGRAGNDLLIGNAGNDFLFGTDGTVGDKDTLTGGSGRDTFVLGNATTVFYDDRNSITPGFNDYALITDFNINDDLIRLNGKRTDYILRAFSGGGNLPAGTAIFRQVNGEVDELIAIVQGSSSLSLNGNYFKFTDDEIDLATLNGNNGFVINSGGAISNAGDVNGDGFDDLIIGISAPNSRYDPRPQEGQSYVIFGKASGFNATFDLATLNGSNGFVINRISGSVLVSSAGDVNGDGFDDLIIGSRAYDFSSGQSYVIFGRASEFDATLDLVELDGSNGFTFTTDGSSVSSAGDINGDGFDDLIIGSPTYDLSYDLSSGQSYVIFGKASGFGASLSSAQLNGNNGFTISDIDEYDGLGRGSNAGDINGDGFDDLIVSAPSADPNNQNNAGKSYVIFGKASGFNANLDLATLNGSNGFVVNGVEADDGLGGSASSAGDINGDGFDDLIIGAPSADPNNQNNAGKSYVIFGKASGFNANLDLTTLNGSNGFVINGVEADDGLGGSVSSAGDINGDGFDDLIIGAPSADPNFQTNAGQSYVIFGKASGFNANLDLATLGGNNGFVINGIDVFDLSGSSVSSAGDIDGDGFDDLIIGSAGADPNDTDAGESYVIFGRDFTNSVTHLGTDGDDTLIGTNGDDVLIGGRGNDRLIGGRGVDVLYGGAGDDTLSFGVRDRRLDGGSGIDTLTVDTNGITIDFTTLPRNQIRSIELIDLTGTGNNNLILTRLNLLNLSDTTNRLIVNGNAGDSVTSTGQGWIRGNETTLDGIRYNQFTAGAATLLVDTDITQIIS
ncbi:FG-GAP-like repeat-containing protein [Gloeocapsopsis sp. IPPAS B-1203]|uniref:FG-GAP-like repeat-containing protein n=1 Tax=Gloeocapsopsis sp. IPPAS B-1203 TaxID=2049454 RepID=UPI000C17D546|nr:FG-GAP-like repeat-containing protein [Gloeocapsopsis sp. IPPAS B-1203]PIG93096.1 hypothetical protein CSQ79_12890 [Gloeocapsopsis sp. IPPAS B-1203]